MARDFLALGKVRSPTETRWTDNSEPELAKLLDDAPLQAVMTRDGVTRQVVEGLAIGFRRTQLVQRADALAIDPPPAICYTSSPPTSEQPSPIRGVRSASEGSAQQQPRTAA
jgi:hypothetical protein